MMTSVDVTNNSGENINGSINNVDDIDLSYDTVFPSLPTSSLNPNASIWSNMTNSTASKLAIKSHHTTQVFHVPVEERRYRDVEAFGNETNQTCENIALRFGVKIEICCSKDQSLHIVISGNEEKVIEAKRAIISELQTEKEFRFKVPREHHKFIIGRNGVVLKDLQEKTCTSISIPKQDQNADYITIVGPKDGIERVIHEIQTICDEQSKTGLERLKIPKMYHPWIRGPYNETMNQIMSNTGAKINIPPLDIDKDEIIVTGDKDKVDIACTEIMKIYKQKKTSIIKKLEIQITKSQHRLIIGKNGSTVQDIFKQFDVYVLVPRADQNSETITLYGDDTKLGKALTEVYSKANSIISTELNVPSWIHRYIIGEKGSNISKITADYPSTHVKFEQNNRITIDGPPDEVEKIKECLSNIANELQAIMSYEELSIDTKYCGHIIGKNYENISRIRQEYGVNIRIPQEPNTLTSKTQIRIEGSSESIQKAKTYLLELLSRIENKKSKDIIIEQKYHSNLIGPGGKNINEIRSKFNDIQIIIPNADEKCDIITVRGDKNEVEACIKHLQLLVREMQISNYKEEIHIAKKYHKIIIGKQGINIKKIRDETNTRIDVPDNSDSDIILITGKKENVVKACKLLNAKVSEIIKIEEDKVNIPHNLHTALIGRGGAIIKQIRNDCGGLIISFPPENDPSDIITLKGTREDIDKAKDELLKLAKHKNELSYTQEICAKQEYHRYLIGPKGITINQLREKYNCRIIFPTGIDLQQNSNDTNNNLNSNGDIITIIGKEENVKKAKAELEATIKSLDDIITDEIVVDSKWHKNFTTKRGKIVNKISEENCNVKISFPRTANSNVVTLKGPKDAVITAKKKINEIVYELENQVTIEVIIPQKYHTNVIGKKGINTQQISEDYRVEIQFPAKLSTNEANDDVSYQNDVDNTDYDAQGQQQQQQPSKLDIVLISGLKDDCEKAKLALLALVPVQENCHIPNEFHVNLLSNNANLLKELTNDFSVQISVPKRGDNADYVTLIGLKENVDKVKEILKEKLNTFELEKKDRELRNFKIEFEIKPELIPLIRGRQGIEAQKLGDKYECRIGFSKKGEEKDRVIIRGYEKNVFEAKEEIERRINEYESKIIQEIQIDTRVHSRIIGTQGKNLKKIIDKLKVDIKFPGRGNSTHTVIVQGDNHDLVDDACDYLKNLEEEYLQDVIDRDAYRHSSSKQDDEVINKNFNTKGFIVKGAPWENAATAQQTQQNSQQNVATFNEPPPDTSNMDDFPSITSAITDNNQSLSLKTSWGVSRK